MTPDKKIDIRGLICPYTFVKSKIAIEDMEIGEVLEILLTMKKLQGVSQSQRKITDIRS